MRLVGSSDPRWITRELLADSLLFLAVLPGGPLRVLDLGSGSGIPGVPIRIVRTDVDMTLVESRRRRASFLSAVVRELALGGLTVVNARVEDVPALRGHFDAVVMRCAGPLSDVIEVATSLVKPGGLVVATGRPGAAASHAVPVEWVSLVDAWGRNRSLAIRGRDST